MLLECHYIIIGVLYMYLFSRLQSGQDLIVVRNVVVHSSGMFVECGRIKQWALDRLVVMATSMIT